MMYQKENRSPKATEYLQSAEIKYLPIFTSMHSENILQNKGKRKKLSKEFTKPIERKVPLVEGK